MQIGPHFHKSFSSSMKHRELLKRIPRIKDAIHWSTHPKIAQISYFFWVAHFLQWQCLVQNCQAQGSNVPMRLSMARCFSFTWRIHGTTVLENVQSYVGVFTATDLPCQIHRQWASKSHHSSWAHRSFNQFSKIPSEEDVKGIDVKWSCWRIDNLLHTNWS